MWVSWRYQERIAAELADIHQVRDRQTSLSTGTPMVINDLDHDVEELVMEDLPDESPQTAQYIISQMELNKTGRQRAMT